MAAIDPAVAYEPGVVPEPLVEPAGLIQFLRLLRDNQLSVYSRDAFVADFGEARFFFHNFVLVNEPDFIEHIRIESNARTDYQDCVIRFIQLISARTCIDCGLPAEMRYREWIRPECADCWARATPAERAAHEARMQRLSADDDYPRPGHRGVTVTTPFGLRIKF